MIIAAWKPKYKRKHIEYWYLTDFNELFEKKRKNLKIVYQCDICGKIKNATSNRLLKSEFVGYNSLEKQICTSCRTKTAERKRNKSIDFNQFKKKLEEEDYIILTYKEDFDFFDYPSQTKVKVMCPRGHIHFVTWVNFSKGKRCRKCYNEKRIENTVKYKEGINNYKFTVMFYTEKSFKKYREQLEKGVKRSSNYHLDHKFSIAEGFRNNIPPYIIGSYCNLEILSGKENIVKRDKCSISKEQLFENYFKGEKI